MFRCIGVLAVILLIGKVPNLYAQGSAPLTTDQKLDLVLRQLTDLNTKVDNLTNRTTDIEVHVGLKPRPFGSPPQPIMTSQTVGTAPMILPSLSPISYNPITKVLFYYDYSMGAYVQMPKPEPPPEPVKEYYTYEYPVTYSYKHSCRLFRCCKW